MSSIRREMQEGRINIAYGHDKAAGYFLHVKDTRLRAEGEDSAWDEICENVYESGEGIYLCVCTRKWGPGQTIEKRMMERLWRTYGVPNEGLALLETELEVIPDAFFEAMHAGGLFGNSEGEEGI